MESADRVAEYFNRRERKRLDEKNVSSTFPEMTAEELVLSCLENGGYETPELNEKLYLHLRGFKSIANLEPYTNLRALWLDSNGLDSLVGLESLTQLRCLYASKNLLSSMTGILGGGLSQLTILDLSYNRLTSLTGISLLPSLQTLNVSQNSLASAAAIEELSKCLSLTNLDLTNNRLPAPHTEGKVVLPGDGTSSPASEDASGDCLVVFAAMPALVALSLNGNEVTRQPHFRKKMLTSCLKLGYLDRPVEEHERRYATAFMAGGAEAEAAERTVVRAEVAKKRADEAEAFRKWQEEQKELREKARAEGRSLVPELSDEEKARRARVAAATTEAEKRLLAQGVGVMAQKYYDYEHRKHLKSAVDPLDAAIQEVLDEQDAAATASEQNVPEDAVIHNDVPTDVEEKVEDEKNESSLPPPVPTAEEIERAEEEARDAAAAAVAAAETEAERLHREQLVYESFEIYKRQLAEKNATEAAKLKAAQAPAPSLENESTQEAQSDIDAVADSLESLVVSPVVAPEDRPLYWTEAMDMELALQIKVCAYDFDAISTSMQASALKGYMRNEVVYRNPERLTASVCRERWAELDASQWSQPAPGVTAQDTLFRVNVSEEVLRRTKGEQPTFENLASLVSGMRPTYLQVPMKLPSVADLDSDNESELDLD